MKRVNINEGLAVVVLIINKLGMMINAGVNEKN